MAENALWKATYDAFWKIVEDSSRWNEPSYQTERALMRPHLEPFVSGILTTCVIFTSFRVSGSRWFRRIQEKYFATSRSSKASSPHTPSNQSTSSHSNWKSHLERQAEARAEASRELSDLPLDLAVSLLCGMSATLYWFDPTALQQDLVRAPLVPGHSLFYDHACPSYEALASDDDELLREILESCRTRDRVIAKRRENGVPDPEHIPFPGLLTKSVLQQQMRKR